VKSNRRRAGDITIHLRRPVHFTRQCRIPHPCKYSDSPNASLRNHPPIFASHSRPLHIINQVPPSRSAGGRPPNDQPVCPSVPSESDDRHRRSLDYFHGRGESLNRRRRPCIIDENDEQVEYLLNRPGPLTRPRGRITRMRSPNPTYTVLGYNTAAV